MSHYAVLVLTYDDQEVEDLLAPYDENLWRDDEPVYIDVKEPKWDWWDIGGRWYGELTTKDGGHCNECKVSELATELTDEEYAELVQEYLDLVAGKRETFFKPEFYEKSYGSADMYARAHAPNVFRAIVTPDGEWYEPGEMGWFGMSDDSPDGWERFVKQYHDMLAKYMDCNATLVDCHI